MNCDPLSSAASGEASCTGFGSIRGDKTVLTLWRRSSWLRLPRREGPGAERGSDLGLSVLGFGGGVGPVVLAGPEGVPP